MRDEINRELAAEGGVWTKQALARMFTLDSAVRESLRLWGFVSRGVLKEVVDADGIVLPASSGVEGLRVKKGTKLGIHATPLHRIESVYPEPDVYKPFRFVHFAEDGEGGNKGTPLVTGTKDFMAFSIGRHGWYVSPVSLHIPDADITQSRSVLRLPTTQARPRVYCAELRNRTDR